MNIEVICVVFIIVVKIIYFVFFDLWCVLVCWVGGWCGNSIMVIEGVKIVVWV